MMKMFTFQYESYGESYTVMSDDKNSALQAVKKYLKEKMEEEKGDYNSYEWERWNNCKIDNLPHGYSIIENEKDEIFESEMA